MRERIPPSLLKAMEKMKDELAGSIVKLRQKYPLIYKRLGPLGQIGRPY
ncbi:hypothetical protein SAMN02745133_00904 [Desulforamulus putei DSM 12395]|uniref:Uncharacterized protein n=1 Tax=Desulforamulus putei DSM 12395 TaxID=1121429 RepID=A0A1M4VET9_9FIRM|nr:hypothetical protein [Desulforamulus putei]SHE67432.1 hypothetical protein SAMN02745133_00904 [Desulforamulus putei DSM 12395]